MSIIETERLTIRHIVADDWKSIKEIWVDFNTSALSQYDMPHITDDDDVQPRITKWAGANSGTEHMFFAICLGDIVIGYSAFNIKKMDTRLAIASTPHITAMATQRKATWHSSIICVNLTSKD